MLQTASSPQTQGNEKFIFLKPEFQKKYPLLDLLGKSKQRFNLFPPIALASQNHSAVMLHGEKGTGQELAARAIHDASDRAAGPFVKFSCAALSEAQFEGRLLGDDSRASVISSHPKTGLLETACRGTFFLEDMEQIPIPSQTKLLGFFQEKNFQKPGSSRKIPVNVRWITATGKNLEEEIRKGRFREDLYYRLNVIPVYLPALREIREDIPQLAHYFLQAFNRENHKKISGISEAVMKSLVHYSWPGNLHELENVMERACVLCTSEALLPEHFPLFRLRKSKDTPEVSSTLSIFPADTAMIRKLPEAVEQLEQQLIQDALRKTGGIQRRASRLLGITERKLGYKLKRYGFKG